MTVRAPGRGQMHLAVCLPGVGGAAVGAGPRAGSPVEFSSFERLARTAERGLFDFLFVAEGLPLGEHVEGVHDPDEAGRPEPVTVLDALAAVTERIGLAATADAAFDEPYGLARRFATLDHLSGGRAAWHMVTSADASTGENFRRGGCLDPAERYPRAAEFLDAARELWDSWTPDGVSRPFSCRGRHFDIAGEFGVPRSPQGRPVVIQAGDSEQGREFAASAADVVLTRHRSLDAGRAFHADVKGRLAKYGRAPGDLKIMPGVTIVLGDTAAEAREKAAVIGRQQVSPQHAILALERIWGTDLSSYDPDGPLPDFDPVPASVLAQGQVRTADPVKVAERWRALSRAGGLSIRQTVIEASGRDSLVGTPQSVADVLDSFVREGAADGFVLVPHPIPGGLDEFVDRVVPLLQERGAFRTRYAGTTLRSHLGLGEPVWTG
ncbi:NtaA/DmoA family FMN-dependent monooxygenase [Streptomyces sp. NBC_00280]|uniref:NtaA/DmoA family FMN-dependent monooxygenase n=1 Tax=Streptomyces sp. NBC_00280 TaxID=2975699 RepID=UPI00324AE0C4